MTRDVWTSLVGYSYLSSRDYYVHEHLSLRKILQVGIQRERGRGREKLVLEEELFYNLQCVIWIGNSVSDSSRIVEYFIIISTLSHIFVKSNKELEVKTNLVGFITEKVNLVEMFISYNPQ